MPGIRQDTLEIHEDAVKPGQRVIICDDLLATPGGKAAATAKSSSKLGGTVAGSRFASNSLSSTAEQL